MTRRSLCSSSSMWVPEINLGRQAWWQAPVVTEPSCRTRCLSLVVYRRKQTRSLLGSVALGDCGKVVSPVPEPST